MIPSPEISQPAPKASLGSILMVEDNQRVSEEITLVLEQAGWNVRCAHDGKDFRRAVAEQAPMMVVLDLNLPGEDGISLCKWLRSTLPDVGIVLLTARVMGSERTEGYVAGADVYLTKPTRPDELLAVLHNLARRATASSAAGRAAQPSPWTLHLKGMRLVSPQLDILSLTPSECALVRALADASGPCTYELLIDQLGSGGLNDRTDKAKLEVLVSRLRTKMRNLKAHGLEIKTVHGSGYRLSQALRISAL
jgi:DNA-binding response OmpR family regulator